MEWDEYLDDGAFYREALDRLIREDNEFDPEPYEPLEHDRYDDNDNEEEEAEYDDYEEEEEEYAAIISDMMKRGDFAPVSDDELKKE